MNQILTFLRTIEGASGFFVPILLFGLFFCPRKCWKNESSAIGFGVISCCLLVLFAISVGSRLISRYLFLPVLFCSFFCGGGIAGFLSKLKPALRPVILWSVCLLICAGSLVQIALRQRKGYIARFAQEIIAGHSDKKGVILYSDQGDANKISAVLKRKLISCELIIEREFSKKSFMTDLPMLDLNEKELYLLVGIPQKQSAAEWMKELQSCCYLTPFDLVKEEVYRQRRLLLLRFNGKVGGSSDVLTSLPDTFPGEIHFNGLKKFHNIRVCDPAVLKAGKGYLFSYSDWYHKTEENFLQHYFQGTIGQQLSFSCCNEYHWPAATVRYQRTVPDTLRKVRTVCFNKGVLPAEDPMLIYPCSRVIFPEKFTPDWSAFAVNQYTGKEYSVTGTEKNGKFSGELIHIGSGKKRAVSFPVIRQKTDILKNCNLKILWLANPHSFPADISGIIADNTGKGVSITRCVDKFYVNTGTAEPSFPRLSPDIVILDIFMRNLFDWGVFEFQRDLFNERMDQLLLLLRKRYPDAQLMVLLPPVPVKRRYQLPRYRLAFLMQQFKERYPQYRLWVIDPVGSVDQKLDHIRPGNHQILNLANNGKRKIAETVAAHLSAFLSRNKSSITGKKK